MATPAEDIVQRIIVIASIRNIGVALGLRVERKAVRVESAIAQNHRRIGRFLRQRRTKVCVDVGRTGVAIGAATGEVKCRRADRLKQTGRIGVDIIIRPFVRVDVGDRGKD